MMRNRRILNIRFAAAMAVVIVLVGGSIHVVHAVQERRLAASLLTRADLAQREGDLERAEKYLGRYMTARPEDDDAFGRYALLLARAAANDAQRLRTLEVLERAIGRDSGRIELRRAAVDLAMLPALGRFRTADEHLESLLKAKPDDGELEELRGLCHEALAREARDPQIELQLANDWYVKAIAHSPDRIVAHERRAILLRGPLAKTPEAEQAADALMDARAEKSGIVARNPKSAAAYLARARYRRANKIAGADADVARALVLAPDDTETILAASEQSKQAGDLDAARRHLERGVAATRGTPDPRLYQALAAVEIRANRSDEAAKVLARGLEARPGDVLLLWDLADVLIGAGRVDDAEKQALAILKKNPTFHPAGLAFLEGRVEIARGHWIEAVALLERARALAGTAPGLAELNKQADLLLADGYGRLGNPERQLAACRRVLAIDPASVPARRGQTAALLTLGRDDDALEEYRKAPNPDSASRLVAARLLIARQARVAEPRRDWTEVDRILGEVRQAEPESLELALLQAEVQSLRGQADLARATPSRPARSTRISPAPGSA
jgi:Tfp pilus assembly protein PilF